MGERQDPFPRPRAAPVLLPQRSDELDEVPEVALLKVEAVVHHADLDDVVKAMDAPQSL